MRYLFMALHHPKPEYRNDLLLYVQRVGAALRAQPGLLQLADFDDAANGRIVAVSIWESAEHFHAAREKAFASLNDEPLYDLWETRPLEVFTLAEIGETDVSPEAGD